MVVVLLGVVPGLEDDEPVMPPPAPQPIMPAITKSRMPRRSHPRQFFGRSEPVMNRPKTGNPPSQKAKIGADTGRISAFGLAVRVMVAVAP